MARVSREKIDQRKACVLEYLHATGTQAREALVSYRRMAELFDISVIQARTVVSQLQDEGLIETRRCFLPSGGQIENAYSVTERGVTFLQKRSEQKGKK